MEVRSPQQPAAARLRASPLPAGFIVSNRWMEHHGGPASLRPSPRLVRPVSSPSVTWPSAQRCCRVPVPFQSVVLSREGAACPAAQTGRCPARFHPKAQACWTTRSCRETGNLSRPFQLLPSGLPRVVARSVRSPFLRVRYTVSRFGPDPERLSPPPDESGLQGGRVRTVTSPPRPRIISTVRQRTVPKECSLGIAASRPGSRRALMHEPCQLYVTRFYYILSDSSGQL
jgi:hypothetical protein